jgi:ABC-type bacteriocin/lantibiotic exporter with double-glycine peptidase domain
MIDEKSKKHQDAQSEAITELIKRRDSVFARFPLAFTLLGTFGLVATFYGFQHLIDRVPLFSHNPLIPLVVGLAILILTGTLYKKLD